MYISDLTEVDSEMYCPEIIYINYNSSANIIWIFEDNWLCSYPKFDILVYDNVTGFKDWDKILMDTCGVETKPNTVKNKS